MHTTKPIRQPTDNPQTLPKHCKTSYFPNLRKSQPR